MDIEGSPVHPGHGRTVPSGGQERTSRSSLEKRENQAVVLRRSSLGRLGREKEKPDSSSGNSRSTDSDKAIVR